MNGLDLVEADQWTLTPYFGDHPFWHINSSTVIHTWIMLGILVLLLIFVRLFLRKKKSMIRFLALSFVRFFINLSNQAMPIFSFDHFVFITSTFCFVLGCNLLALIPFLEKEPTTDLNTTLSLGIVAFIYTQGASIINIGIWQYIKGYFSPIFLMLPLNIVGKLATIVSISFRLFGNIFGGSIITNLWFSLVQKSFLFELVGIFSGINLLIVLFFNVFEGFLQAFVFAMLSLTYLALAVQGEGH